MHSIERYGIVALLFLIVTVVAVLMWDGAKEPKPSDAPVTAKAPPAKGLSEAERAALRERRLELQAEARPGPLARRPAAESSEAAQQPLERPALDPEAAAVPEGSSEPMETQTPREERLEDDFIAAESQKLSAPPPATKEPAVATGATRPYAVRAGDTLSEIAQRELGSSRRWSEIVAANPGLEPAKLRSGTTIRIPGATPVASTTQASAPKEAARAKDAPAAGTGTWTVGKGENLWRIAERALGDGKRWGEIAKLNPGIDPNKLLLGQKLKLPAGAKGGTPAKPGATPPTKAARESTPVVAQAATADQPRRGGKVK